MRDKFVGANSEEPRQWHEPRSVKDVLRNLISDFDDGGSMYLIYQNWTEAVGETIASHCKPLRVVDAYLLIEVDHPGWATEIRYLEAELVTKLTQIDPKLKFSGLKVQVKG